MTSKPVTDPSPAEPLDVLASRQSVTDRRVTWQARRSADRGRLEVVAVVPPSTEPTLVPLLTQAELLELLGETLAGDEDTWGRA